MVKIKVAIAGVGNCASALVQGVYYYSHKNDYTGLAYPELGGYYPSDIEFVAAFDVNKKKVGKDLSEAIFAEPNNTIKFFEPPRIGVRVERGPVLDGIGKYLSSKIELSEEKECSVEDVLRESKPDLLINYLPVGSEQGSRFYAQSSLNSGVAFVNAMPTFIASDASWQKKFEDAGLPIAGDDIMSQLGATVLHKTLAKLLVDRGVKIDESYQINIGGDTDFLNMLEQKRLVSKRESKTSAVKAMIPYDEFGLRIGPSDYVPFLNNEKICYIFIKGRYFGGTPLSINLKLSVVDSPNSAGVMIDVIRAVKIAKDRGISGPLISVSAYAFKHPPIQMPYDVAKRHLEAFVEGKEER
ncbi:MAG: inositol-3-phosphate synthase [Candidatus Brockarchaeota archaeon]|nr:inositol-3-phosphate synthase [Candidatus Brockarchaeota archaeon]MBO3768547.1 inositol-3-phosphate synthase [Candidatus Brockarchaeota archaeon]